MDSKEYTIADKSYNKDTGELEQFLVFWNGGEPELKKASTENYLLFDPEDKLPFDGGLYDFLNGQKGLVISEEDPELMVAPTESEYSYIIRVNGDTIETTPNESSKVLDAIKKALVDEDFDALVSAYDRIKRHQVRKEVVNTLRYTFEEKDRIEVTARGWLIDDLYLVDWSASLYTKHDDPEEGDYVRQGSEAVKMDKSYEFIILDINRDINPVEVGINGDTYRLTEREMLFLTKVKWLLNRRHYHKDMPFWYYADQWASVDWKTGEPVKNDDAPDLKSFEL